MTVVARFAARLGVGDLANQVVAHLDERIVVADVGRRGHQLGEPVDVRLERLMSSDITERFVTALPGLGVSTTPRVAPDEVLSNT